MPTTGRATREAGKTTRKSLLRAAAEVFAENGESASVAQICQRADAYPNQVTYYFGSKEQLFAETVREYTNTLVGTLLGPCARDVELFATAMLLVARRTDLRPLITDTLTVLHERGEEALLSTLVRTGWQLRAGIDVEARAFWSAIFGLAVQKASTGADFGYRLEDAVAVVFTNLQIPDEVLDSPLRPVGPLRPVDTDTNTDTDTDTDTPSPAAQEA